VIRFEALSKSFGAHHAVRALTLTVRAGEVVALLGPNGSGKTTSLKAAAGLLRPSSGQVRVGEPGQPATVPGARRVLSFLPQKVAFPDLLTGREVVEFYRHLRGVDPARTDEVLRVAALNGAAGRQVGTYSGGMTQRLGLAVAALPEAPVLLLDEPTSSLDLGAQLDIAALLVELNRARGVTVVVSTHDLALAQIAESLAPRASNVHFEDHLADGKVVFDYRMRPGVVEHSNALELMRAVGLDV